MDIVVSVAVKYERRQRKNNGKKDTGGDEPDRQFSDAGGEFGSGSKRTELKMYFERAAAAKDWADQCKCGKDDTRI